MARPLVPDRLGSLPGYVAGVRPAELAASHGIEGGLKLSSNENAWGPSPTVAEALRGVLAELHRYPESGAHSLRARIAAWVGRPADRVLVGNGSDEVIDLVFRGLAEPGDTVVASASCFLRYRIAAHAAGLDWQPVPLRDRWHQDLDAMAHAVRRHGARVVVLVNPSNPTGTWFDHEALVAFLDQLADDVVVLVDEAYAEFADPGTLPRTWELSDTRPAMVVLRTFSKAWGLCAVRVGYAVTDPRIVAALERMRPPFSVDRFAQVAACTALDDPDHLHAVAAAVRLGRRELADALTGLGVQVPPSQANFLLASFGRPARPIYQALLSRGVIVRELEAYGMQDSLRLTVGRPQDNLRLIAALAEVLAPAPRTL